MWWVLGVSSALAWGPEAHEAIGERAERRLSPEARAALLAITDEPLAALSTRLDDYRGAPGWRWSRALHFVNIDPLADRLEPTRDCPDHRCATAAVAHFAHRLAASDDREERLEALWMVVHLVADLHQPMHVSYAHDRGGNDHLIWHDGERTDLHALWDDVLPVAALALTPPQVSGGVAPEDWAAESFLITREFAYTAPAGAAVSDAYLARAEPLVALQLARASARLAELLEGALLGAAPALVDPLAGGRYPRVSSPLDSAAGRGMVVLTALLLLGGLVGGRWWLRQREGRTTGHRILLELLQTPLLLAVSLAAILMTITVDVLTPLVSQYTFDVIIPAPTAEHMVMLLGLFSLSMVASILGWWLAARSLTRLTTQLQDRLRVRMLVSLQGASLKQVQSHSVSDILSRFQSDLQQFDGFLLRELPKITRSVVQSVVLFAVMLGLDWRLTLLTLLLLPAVIWLPRRMSGQARHARSRRQEAEAAAGEVVVELVESQDTLRAFGLESRWRERFAQRADQLSEAARRQGWLTVMIPGVGFTAGQFLLSVVLLGAVWLTLRGVLTVGGIAAMFTALTLLTGSISRLATALPATVAAGSAFDRVSALLDLPQTPQPAELPAPPAPLVEGIRLEGVGFSHTGQVQHLSGLSLQIRAGQATAVVGPSGAGKSTLLWLLLCHAQPGSGRILWDRAELRPTHRSVIGLVPQHSPLFSLSVRENIRLGDLSASDEAVEAAARQAAIHDAILALPDGYDTLLGPGGVQLSGGQRQRIAIARALLRAPSLLILDEATSALDPATAAQIRQTLDEVRRDCTTLTITHDLAAVRDYDHIVVLADGALAAEGTHESLMAGSPLYRSLVEQQSGFEIQGQGRRARVLPERLEKIPIFARIPRLLLERLAAVMVTEIWQDGETVVTAGAPGDRMFLIARGSLIATVPGGGRRVCDAGTYVGEIALLYDRPRTATLTAQGFCVLLSIAREDFLSTLESAPEVREQVLQTARQRLEADRSDM